MLHVAPFVVLVAAASRFPNIAWTEAAAVPTLWVPRTSSTSCDQPGFVDHATDASVPSDTVLLKIDPFG
jgi:hypothetical protein